MLFGGGWLGNELLIVNLSDYSMRKLALPKNNQCPAHDPETPMPENVDILASEISTLGDVQIVDIRNPEEVAAEPLPCDHIHIPMDQLLNQPTLLEKEATYLLVCAAGVRTQYTANAFRSAGYKNVYSLVGGNRMLGKA